MKTLNSARRFLAGVAFAAMAASGGVAFAATQGTVGATSTGSLNITLTIPQLVRITGLTDITMPTWDGSTDIQGTDNVCVFSSTRRYTVTATGSGASSAFTLADGTAPTPNTIAYAVEWAASSGASSGTGLTSGTALTAQTTNATSTTCAGGTNATVIVKITSANLSAAPSAGTNYTGTLTLVVAPD